jgi:hypothetical protein
MTVDLIRSKKLAKQLSADDANTEKSIIRKWGAAYRFSIAVYIFVVISTLLGWFKPGLTTFS